MKNPLDCFYMADLLMFNIDYIGCLPVVFCNRHAYYFYYTVNDSEWTGRNRAKTEK